VKSSQNSPDLIVLQGQDGEGPGATAERIEKILWSIVMGRNFHASQALTPVSLQPRLGELVEDQKTLRTSGWLGRRILRRVLMTFLLIGCCHC
jgi:hypothetical protein